MGAALLTCSFRTPLPLRYAGFILDSELIKPQTMVETRSTTTPSSLYTHSGLTTMPLDSLSACADAVQFLCLHIGSLSMPCALPIVRTSKASGMLSTTETHFHYLMLMVLRIQAGYFKSNGAR